jgi:hypothetical protein
MTIVINNRGFICFSFLIAYIFHLDHKLKVLPKKKKREKRKTRIYNTFLTPLSTPKTHLCVN